MSGFEYTLAPAKLLLEHCHLFLALPFTGPILDLACGDGSNGIFMAMYQKDLPVICCDRAMEALERARRLASHYGVTVTPWQKDLEKKGTNPLQEDFYMGILVFRYLHRPLMPCIKKAIKSQGLLVYETYTTDQPSFGKPRNPDFLLRPGELKAWFEGWEIIHYFEGIKDGPQRAVAQLVAQKPKDREIAG